MTSFADWIWESTSNLDLKTSFCFSISLSGWLRSSCQRSYFILLMSEVIYVWDWLTDCSSNCEWCLVNWKNVFAFEVSREVLLLKSAWLNIWCQNCICIRFNHEWHRASVWPKWDLCCIIRQKAINRLWIVCNCLSLI